MNSRATIAAAPRDGSREARRETIAVASYNVHGCRGLDGHEDVDRIARVLAELECDVVGLQEVNSRGEIGHPTRQLDRLAAATGFAAVPGLTIVREQSEYGNALLTRLPVVGVRRHDLAFRRREPRGALEADLALGEGRVITAIVTHLGLAPSERRHQVQRLLSIVSAMEASRPVILLGDINEWLPVGRPLRWVHGLLGWAPAAATFPSRRPLFALDRIWTRPASALERFDVHRSALARIASDHLPVKARVKVS